MKIVNGYYRPKTLSFNEVNKAYIDALRKLLDEAKKKDDAFALKVCTDLLAMVEPNVPDGLSLKIRSYISNKLAQLPGEWWRESLVDVMIAHKDNLLLLELAPPKLKEVSTALDSLLEVHKNTPAFQAAKESCETLHTSLLSDAALEDKLLCVQSELGKLNKLDLKYKSWSDCQNVSEQGNHILHLLEWCLDAFLVCLKTSLLQLQGLPKKREHYRFHAPQYENTSALLAQFNIALEALNEASEKLQESFGYPDEMTF